jgi:polar amino acid transport system substrate-binding protein
MLLMPVMPAVAAPLNGVLAGDYQPLRATEAEPVSAGFEAALLTRLGKAIDHDISLTRDGAQPDLRIGAVDQGPVYYSSQLTALTASDAGPQSWAELAGQTVCISEGSPHLQSISSRYGGIARPYPSAAQALIGLKLGECQAVAGDQVLLEQIAQLPEWRRYNRLLPVQDAVAVTLRVEADSPALQQQIEQVLAEQQGQAILAEVRQFWIEEVAFQAYVLADTLDCH